LDKDRLILKAVPNFGRCTGSEYLTIFAISFQQQFSFTNLKKTYALWLSDGNPVSLEKKNLSKPDIEMTAENSLVENILNKTATQSRHTC